MYNIHNPDNENPPIKVNIIPLYSQYAKILYNISNIKSTIGRYFMDIKNIL